jgi:hypothetical protein
VKRVAALLLAGALLAPCSVVAQSMLTIAYDKVVTVNVPGATSAYAVNPLIAQAGVVDGVVQIRGTGGGTTSVVIVTPGGTQTIDVTVMVPALTAALTGEQAGQGSAGGLPGSGLSGGSYVGNFNSSGGQLTNTIEFHNRQGDTTREVILATATGVSPGTSRTTGFPILSYTVSRPGMSITYLDQSVSTSPLTFSDALVRGIHLQVGPWIFHAGASSIAGFGQYFVLADSQWMAGVTRGFTLSNTSTLAANLYDIVNAPTPAVTTAQGGVLGSLLYTYRPSSHFIAQAEAGLSRALGFSASAVYDDKTTHADATLLDKPYQFATLATDGQQGLMGTFDYSRTLGAEASVDVNGQRTDYDLPTFRDSSETIQGTFNDRLSPVFSVTGGMLYTDFDSSFPIAVETRTLGVPITIAYTTRHFNAGLLYQPTTDFSGTIASGYGASAGMNEGPFTLSGSFNHNVDIPAVSSIFSDVPGLQAALEQAGINVNDPSQLAALLGNAALLASLGFKGLSLDIAPSQNVFAVNGAWNQTSGRQQINFNYLSSDSALTQGSFAFRMATVGYSRRLDRSDVLNTSVSWLDTTQNGATYNATQAISQTNVSHNAQLTYGVQITHRFATTPAWLFPAKRGTIEGYVFTDDDATGRFAKGDPGIAGIDVTLDGQRTTQTDATGHYSFGGVPVGTHEVAAGVPSRKPFYYTTDSPATVATGSTANFGVSYVQGKILGYVTNDAGQGLGGIVVQIQGLNKRITTEDDGRFVVSGVASGHYTVTASPDSFPPGYDLSTIATVGVDVTTSAAWPVTVTAHALRSVSGTVTDFDPIHGTLSVSAGIDVSIPALGISSTTDSNGVYTLRNLPPGTYTIQVDGGSSSERQSITVPTDPVTLTGIDFRITAAQASSAERKLRHRSRQ